MTHRTSPAGLRPASGFTLIEIAMVMVVIGLLLSGAILAIGPVMDNTRSAETHQKLAQIEEALRLYAIRNGCLPCPADGSIATGDTDYGEAQDASGGVYAPATCTADACITASGVVPWLTLGITEADITDGWGNRVTYQLGTSSAIQTANATSPCPTLGAETSYSLGICRATTNYPTGNIAVQLADTTVISGAAIYVLVSHGADGNGARAADTGAVQQGGNVTAAQTENSDGDGTFVQDVLNSVPANYFDDVVIWRTGPAFVQSCGVGSCGN